MNWASFAIGTGVGFLAFCIPSVSVSLWAMKHPHYVMRQMMKNGAKRKAA